DSFLCLVLAYIFSVPGARRHLPSFPTRRSSDLAAFTRAGFDAFDVHMSDILAGRDDLRRYQGLVACGGFSFGDVLGAGGGWAKSDRKSTRLNSSHVKISYAVFCLKKKITDMSAE